MSCFPTEIINHIGSFLDFTSLTNAQQVNREWYHSITETVKDRYEKIPWVIGVYYVNSGNESHIYNAFICIGYPTHPGVLCRKYTPLGGIADLQLIFLHGKGGDFLQRESLSFDINMIHSTITLVSDNRVRKSFHRRFDIDTHRIIGNLDHTCKFDIPVSRDWWEEPTAFGKSMPATPVYSYYPPSHGSSSHDSEDMCSDDSDDSDDEMDW